MDRSSLIDEQYRPVSQAETQADDAASVRAGRDFALGIDNAFARACAPHLVDMWPWGATGIMITSQNDTDEHVVGGVMRFPPLKCGDAGHYTHAGWSVVAFIGASSNNCTLRLYSGERYYNGPTTMVSGGVTFAVLMGSYSSSSLTITSTGCDVKSSGDFALLLHPNALGETHFLLTAEFAAAPANNSITVLSAPITLGRGSADIL